MTLRLGCEIEGMMAETREHENDHIIDVDTFRAIIRANPEKGKLVRGVFRAHVGKPKIFEDGSRKVRFVFSTGETDRMGDQISPDGWQLEEFQRNPVALFAHDSSAPPIGRASNVVLESKRLMGDIEFAQRDVYEFADTIYRLVAGGYLNACSVGFLPLKYSFVENDPDRGFGINFEQQTLLEISVVPVPALASALVDARSKGINTAPLVGWAERILDGADKTTIPRTELEALRRAAQEPRMTRRTTGARHRADEDKPDDDDKKSCGRKASETCTMDDPSQCSVHGRSDDDDTEKALLRALRRILRRSEGDEPDGDEPPLAHEDSIRLAHKSLRTSKAFLAEAVTHHAKAMDLLDDVVDALNDVPDDDKSEDDADPDADPNDDPDPDSDKAARRRRERAAARKRRLAGA